MDMDTELEPSWKKVFHTRVVMADLLCSSANEMLRTMGVDLVEMGVHEQAPGAEETQRCQRALEYAGTMLGLGLASMGAARHIALRVGKALESVDDLAGDPDVLYALQWLEEAEVHATDEHDRVEAARGHLSAAALLRVLDDEGGGGGDDDEDARDVAPWEHSPCHSQWMDAVIELSEALWKAVDLVRAIAAARKAAFGYSGSTD